MDQEFSRSPDYIQILRIYKLPILLGITSVVLIIISIVLIIKSAQTTTPIVFSSEASVAGSMSSIIHIDIEGAVISPGVYELPSGSRVEDAIIAAGGFTGDADEEKIAATLNRAAKVVDGGKIYIPKEGADVNTMTSHNSESLSQRDSRPDNDSLININSSSQFQLESLPGIGPVTATKIIDNRPYQTLEELVSKKAVGSSVFEKIKDQIAL